MHMYYTQYMFVLLLYTYHSHIILFLIHYITSVQTDASIPLPQSRPLRGQSYYTDHDPDGLIYRDRDRTDRSSVSSHWNLKSSAPGSPTASRISFNPTKDQLRRFSQTSPVDLSLLDVQALSDSDSDSINLTSPQAAIDAAAIEAATTAAAMKAEAARLAAVEAAAQLTEVQLFDAQKGVLAMQLLGETVDKIEGSLVRKVRVYTCMCILLFICLCTDVYVILLYYVML